MTLLVKDGAQHLEHVSLNKKCESRLHDTSYLDRHLVRLCANCFRRLIERSRVPSFVPPGRMVLLWESGGLRRPANLPRPFGTERGGALSRNLEVWRRADDELPHQIVIQEPQQRHRIPCGPYQLVKHFKLCQLGGLEGVPTNAARQVVI